MTLVMLEVITKEGATRHGGPAAAAGLARGILPAGCPPQSMGYISDDHISDDAVIIGGCPPDGPWAAHHSR